MRRGRFFLVGVLDFLFELAHVVRWQRVAHFTQRTAGLVRVERATVKIDADDAHPTIVRASPPPSNPFSRVRRPLALFLLSLRGENRHTPVTATLARAR